MYHPYPDDQNQAVLKARQLLDQNPVFLDTETTGLGQDGEICEIAIIDMAGNSLLNTLVKSIKPIPETATNIHGITNEMVQNARTFKDLLPELNKILNERTVLVYNMQFDISMIVYSAMANGLEWNPDQADGFKYWWWPPDKTCWHCAMELYATYYGDFNDYHGSYRWQRLGNAVLQCGIDLPLSVHRALADAELTRRVMLHVAGMEPESIQKPTEEKPNEPG